ncbi:hypothetical protein [Variovorax guangxiensis]|uniref:hypothetical protein n=1 Tax=Variovorax guangxiensis TaxID=1775474 RepID=UPI0028554E7A|nr:hypothetical protein [Variovorax guangxiensis]MDR6861369.1 hypothetical protein [Variovorax guangxiensis]
MRGSAAPAARSLGERIAALHAAARELAQRPRRPRQERLSGLHNPWGHGGALVDPWLLLDLCEDPEVLDGVEALIGPDIVLWDAELYLEAAAYQRFVEEGREGRYWPALPLQGALVLVPAGRSAQPVTCVDLARMAQEGLPALDPLSPLYVLRYMPATSHFVRDGRALANWVAMEEQPLINYTTRPLWLMRGEDRAGSDFVTGFSPSVPRWAGNQPKEN